MNTYQFTDQERDTLELLVLLQQQHLDRNNKTASPEFKGLEGLARKLRTPKPLTDGDIQNLHDNCF